ncbi:MAG: hypothetical protein [Olavius algarvensis Gamma 1 endosymbiont]|nr:MAG: hypothetical protein [Olavius algarvensis Gamma 1 endosymbiont]
MRGFGFLLMRLNTAGSLTIPTNLARHRLRPTSSQLGLGREPPIDRITQD